MKPKNGEILNQKQLLKGIKPCKKCGSKDQEFEEIGESGMHKRIVCLGCDQTTIWAFQSIVCIDKWNEVI